MPRHTAQRRAIGTLGALAFLLAAVAGLQLAEPAHAADEVGVSLRPANSDGSTSSRDRFSYEADPGQSVEDYAIVQNTGSLPQRFTVLSTDAFNAEDGSYGILNTADQPKDIGNWVAFENGERTIQRDLAPGEKWLVPFTVTVPANASAGDHAGGIAASVVTAGANVSVDRRTAARMYVRVSGDLQAVLTVTDFTAEYQGEWWDLFGGKVHVHYTVQNNGNVALASNARSLVRTWFGAAVGGSDYTKVPELLPGSKVQQDVVLDGVGQWGYLNPQLSVEPFVDDDVRAQLAAEVINRDAVLWVTPWITLGIVVLVLVGVGVWWWLRRREARRTAEWIAYTEEEARRRATEELTAASADEQ